MIHGQKSGRWLPWWLPFVPLSMVARASCLENLCGRSDNRSMREHRLGADRPNPRRGVTVARTLRLVLASIALLAHVGSAPSLLAAAAPDQQTEQRDCCAPEGETPDGATPQESGDCCPDGCKHCPMSCCGGSPALASAFPVGVGSPVASPALLVVTSALLPPTDPREIYHPPRI